MFYRAVDINSPVVYKGRNYYTEDSLNVMVAGLRCRQPDYTHPQGDKKLGFKKSGTGYCT